MLYLGAGVHCYWLALEQLNSLSHAGCCFNLKCVIFKGMTVITFMSFSSATAFKWMAKDPTNEKSKFAWVMAWCYEATSQYLNQCWKNSTPMLTEELTMFCFLNTGWNGSFISWFSHPLMKKIQTYPIFLVFTTLYKFKQGISNKNYNWIPVSHNNKCT